MSKNNKKFKSFISYVFLLFAPALVCLLSIVTASVERYDYNKTLIKNINKNIDSDTKNYLLNFDNGVYETYKDWDINSSIINSDFFGQTTLFRTSSETISIKNTNDESVNVLFSDIKQCEIQNNQRWSYSALYISTSMEEFQEDSIFVSDALASILSINVDDSISFVSNEETINLKVIGIYGQYKQNLRYLNSSYYEFEQPVCFVHEEIFNKIFAQKYRPYIYFYGPSKIIETSINELIPFLSTNQSKLTVPGSFTVNNISFLDTNLKDFQTLLLESYKKDNKYQLPIMIGLSALLFAFILYATFECIKFLVSNEHGFHSHIVSLNFVYSFFMVAISLFTAWFLSNYMDSYQSGKFTLYRSLKWPLIVLAGAVIIYISLVALASYFASKKATIAAKENRKEQIRSFESNNKKLIFVTGSLSRGGAEKVIVELANYYASLGREVEIVLLLNNKVEWDINKKIKVIDFSGSTTSRIKRIGYWIKNLKKYFHDNAGSTIVSFLVRVNILVLLSANQNEHKIIVSERNDPRYDGRNFVISSFVNLLYPKADIIVFQTNECKELFAKNIREKGVVIPNPITINKYANLNKYDKNYFISAGRLAKQKNQITMIRAMAKVTEKYKDVKLHIYGNGDLEEKLKKIIKKYNLENNVKIFPNIKEINKEMLNARAYICTSLYEGMSNSLMEASFAGVPCVSTKCLGTDFIIDGENGFFIGFESPKELANKMIEILGNEQEYIGLRKRAINIAKNTTHNDVYSIWKDTIDNE